MRVHERGVGETRRAAPEPSPPRSRRWHSTARPRARCGCASPAVRSPSTVTDATSYLRGPSVLVARRRAVRGMVARCSSVNSSARAAVAVQTCYSLMTYPDFPINDTPSAGELALEDRAALRRVAGLSTELADVSEVEYRQLRLERVVLVGVWTEGSAADAEASMAELAALAETAGSEVLEGLDPAPRQARPVDLHRLGQGAGAARGRGGHRRRHRHLRR